MQQQFIIIGTSAAGVGCAQKLRQLNPDAQVMLISDEKEMPYNKCFLADYLSEEKTIDQVYTLTPKLVEQKKFDLVLGVRVEQINAQAKTVVCNNGKTYAYDALFIGTGASPFIPTLFKRPDVTGIFTFHGLADTQALLDCVASMEVRKAVIIGAGLSGLECADALSVHGVRVSIIERNTQVLANQIDDQGAAYIHELLRIHKIDWYPEESVQELIITDNQIEGVILSSGITLHADLIVVATGQRPNIQLAQQAGIELEHGGIKVNEFMQTSISDMYAGGDVACVYDQISGGNVQSCLWPDAMLQGMIAACAMSGEPKPYPGAIVMTSSAFFGAKFASCGPVAHPEQHLVFKRFTSQLGYRAYLLEGDILRGFVLIGDTSKLALLKRALLTKHPVDSSLLT